MEHTGTKRSYGESQSADSSATSLARQAAAYDTAAKRVKAEAPATSYTEAIPDSLSPDPPSKVIHFRNVTSEIAQEDMIELAAPFGTVEKVVMMATKNQALLEFRDLSSAVSMSNFYVNTQPMVRGRKVYMRFSRHQALNAAASSVNRILLVTLHTDQEPVIQITADIIWQIYSSYGVIEKIVVINKPAEDSRGKGLQALVQYQSPSSAQTASQYLNGKTVYVGTDPILSITLYIQYSHLQELTIKHNSATARDYTTPVPAWGGQYGGQAYNYPPQYPPQGYPPNYGYPGMPDMSGGYPDMSGGYPDPSGGYPDPSGGYPDMSGGYPGAPDMSGMPPGSQYRG